MLARGCSSFRLPQPHARTAAVLIDEFDAPAIHHLRRSSPAEAIPYVILLAGTGADSYSAGDATKGSDEAAKFVNGGAPPNV